MAVWCQWGPDAGPGLARYVVCGMQYTTNSHTKQLLHSKTSSAQFHVVGPIYAAPAIPACHKRPFACVWPTNGQTAKDRAKPSPPLHSPLDLSPTKKSCGPADFIGAPASATESCLGQDHQRRGGGTGNRRPGATNNRTPTAGGGLRARRARPGGGAGAGAGGRPGS